MFWKYFWLNFEFLGLKKLTSTHYDSNNPTYKLETVDGKIITRTELQQNGDFRSPECIEILKESDMVITNPPFSLFREFVSQLMEYEKEFIIIGPMNAITYKEIFKLIKDNKMWLGYTHPKEFVTEENKHTLWENYGKNAITVKFGNINWFTNLEISKRHEELILYKHYTPEEYPHYDNYDAININRVADIPIDYSGVMGVPITLLDKYNPEQFEIIDINPHFFTIVEQGLEKPKQLKIVGQKDPYARILIIKKELSNGN
jgi:hypothetical protein